MSQEAVTTPQALPPVAGPRMMGERADGLRIVPRRQALSGPAGSLDNQFNAPYIPPLLEFERDADPAGEEETWYEYDPETGQFRRSQPGRITWGGGLFSSLVYQRQTYDRGADPSDGGDSDFLNTNFGGTVSVALGQPGGKFSFDLAYGLGLGSNWGDERIDSLNHNLALSMRLNAAKTSGSVNFTAFDQLYNNSEIGGLVDAAQANLNGSLEYRMRPKLTLGATGFTQLDLFQDEALQDSTNFGLGAFVDYRIRPKLSIGAGYNMRLSEFGDNSQQLINNQINGRLNWNTSARLSLGGSLGYDLTVAEDFSRASAAWTIAASYQLGARSSLSLSSMRQTMPSSLLESQFLYTTNVMLTASTSLTERISIGAGAGVQSTTYEGTQASVVADREDLGTNWSVFLGYRLGRRTQIALSYNHFSNDSTGTGSRPSQWDQLSLSVGLSF